MESAHSELSLFVCSVLTTLGSFAAATMEGLVFLGVGWDSGLFDFLLVVTLLSSLGLVVGTAGLLVGRAWAMVTVIIASAYIPIALITLTLEGFAPPAGWWLLLPLSLCEIAFGMSTLRARRHTVVV